MRDGGKGDKARPLSVPLEKFDNNWDAIFKKKPEPIMDFTKHNRVMSECYPGHVWDNLPHDTDKK